MFIESPLHLRHCSRPYIGCRAEHCPDLRGLFVCAKSLSHIWLCATPGTVVLQDPLSMGFSRQEYWSGLSSPSPRDLPDPGIEPMSLIPALAGGFSSTSTAWEAPYICIHKYTGRYPSRTINIHVKCRSLYNKLCKVWPMDWLVAAL